MSYFVHARWALFYDIVFFSYFIVGNGDIQWCFSQVKGTLEDDVTEGNYLFFNLG